MLTKNLFVFVFAAVISGCSIQNSIPVTYHKQPISGVKVDNTDSIGVTQWRDKRNIAGVKDKYSESAVIRMGGATIGMTHNGQKFVRVADFVRLNFIEELQSLGVNARTIEVMPASSDKELLANIAQNNNVKMVISADLMNFDFNCAGAWTLECTRSVSFSMSMVDKDGKEIITREVFDANMSNNEGMGVLHQTVLDQIANNVMREALKKAVIRTAQQLNAAKSVAETGLIASE
ncbi:hypothetical protein [Shewanella zhangzhouensis]|uniref:hypothetical protein n=1 Tax=Shewanella zhangzhouensis TaxID=2864213 RepID=UPI001C658C80|nr:hypothetical protein [Shewanella zhangzhouensis]QYK04937.1 hypothetical protein K0H63_18130 [Shewanella zhangzhouensis]